MNRNYFPIAKKEVGPLTLVFDYTEEDVPVRDCMEEDEATFQNIEYRIKNGDLTWFILRGRALFLDGSELADAYLGGCLYADPTDIMTNGVADDMIEDLLSIAKFRISLFQKVDLSSF